MFQSLFASGTELSVSPLNLLLTVGVALLLGLVISTVYMKTHRDSTPSQGFAITLVVLPMIITMIILLIGNSVARAFSLAGAFQIIRFRSQAGGPKDITFILFSMAIGLCSGLGYLAYGVIATIILSAILLALEGLRFAKPKAEHKILKITIPEDLDYSNAFDDVLAKYTSKHRCTKVKTTGLGAFFELTFSINSKPGINEKAFIDALRCKNGNLNIALLQEAPQGDF